MEEEAIPSKSAAATSRPALLLLLLLAAAAPRFRHFHFYLFPGWSARPGDPA